MKIAIVMPYWNDSPNYTQRYMNVMYCWDNLKKLNSFLRDNAIECAATLYDFSVRKTIPDATHISANIIGFNKSKKMNIICSNLPDIDFLFSVDADMFFDESDYTNILNVLKNIQYGDIYTFDAAKLDKDDSLTAIRTGTIDFTWEWWYAYSGPKNNGPLCKHNGGLGGAFIVDMKLLKNVNGFDEKITSWGGEDGQALADISRGRIDMNLVPIKHFAPFHLDHTIDDLRMKQLHTECDTY